MSNDYSDISNYEMIKTLGEGNFGKVKLAKFKITNEEFAIKIMSKRQIKIKMRNSNFREIEIISKLNHINIANVFEIIDDIEYYYIIMEYCQGGELFEYITSKRKLEELEAALFFYQLINCVEYIHSKKISHRDLKLENLLLTKKKLLKIIDFGLSHEFDGENLLQTKCGSPSYASPEIVKGEKYDGFKVDIWCCGIILYAMVCGFLPFDTEDQNDKILFEKILLCDPEIPKFLSEDVKILIKAMLTLDPKNRISIKEIKKSNFYFRGKKMCDICYNCLLSEYYINKKKIAAKEKKNYFYKKETTSISNNYRSEKRKRFKDIECKSENKHYTNTNVYSTNKNSKRTLNLSRKNNILNKSKKSYQKNLNYSYKFAAIGEKLKTILNINTVLDTNNENKDKNKNDNNTNTLNNEISNKIETENLNNFNVNKKRFIRLIDPINSNKFPMEDSSLRRTNNFCFNKKYNFQLNEKTISVNKNGIFKIINKNRAIKPTSTEKNETLDYSNKLTIQSNIKNNNYTPMRTSIVSLKQIANKTPDHPLRLMLNNVNANINTKYKNNNTEINKETLSTLNSNKRKNKATCLRMDKSRNKNANFKNIDINDIKGKIDVSNIVEKYNAKNDITRLNAFINLNNQDKSKFKNKFLIKGNGFENGFLQEIRIAKGDKIIPITHRKIIEGINEINDMKINSNRENILPFIRFSKED